MMKYSDHHTVIENLQERIQNGKPLSEVEQILLDPMIHGMNGPPQLTSFMDLVDGAERFGTRVEKMENERKALGYEGKLGITNENDTLSEFTKKKGREIEKKGERGVVAFDLFMRPHQVGGIRRGIEPKRRQQRKRIR